jgi:hypothetical protein
LNVPPPRDLNKLRQQQADYSEAQKEQSRKRRAIAVARMRKLEEEMRMREVRREHERDLTNVGQSTRIVIYERPPFVRSG